MNTYNLNSGVALYLSNSSFHCVSDKGGSTPVIGRHSVILRPDSVRRVTPPTTMTAKTSTDDNSNHPATGGGESTGSSAASAGAAEALAEKNRGSKDGRRFARRVIHLVCVHKPERSSNPLTGLADVAKECELLRGKRSSKGFTGTLE